MKTTLIGVSQPLKESVLTPSLISHITVHPLALKSQAQRIVDVRPMRRLPERKLAAWTSLVHHELTPVALGRRPSQRPPHSSRDRLPRLRSSLATVSGGTTVSIVRKTMLPDGPASSTTGTPCFVARFASSVMITAVPGLSTSE